MMKRLSMFAAAILFLCLFAASASAKDLIDLNLVKMGMSKEEVGAVMRQKYEVFRLDKNITAGVMYSKLTENQDLKFHYMRPANLQAAGVELRGASSMSIDNTSFVFIDDKLSQISISIPGDFRPLLSELAGTYDARVKTLEKTPGMTSMFLYGTKASNGMEMFAYYYVAQGSEQAPNNWLVFSVEGFEQKLRERMK